MYSLEWIEHGNLSKVFVGTDFIGIVAYLNHGEWAAIDPVGRTQGRNWSTAQYAADALHRVYKG